jgi:methyltransferase (TIGR00027 family)
MSAPQRPPLRNISDTARWVAVYRARESARPDAVFRDPLAARLAGVEGEAIADSLPAGSNAASAVVARTHVIDQMVAAQVTKGTDMVINLAAGLDTRPYRMRLPASLLWVEVDLPDLLAYKVEKLIGERPACKLERIACDLSDRSSRRELLGKLNARGRNILVITEGLLIYLSNTKVAAVAEDLTWASHVQHWILELVNPALLQRLQVTLGRRLAEQANAPLKFGPAEGPAYFERFGWKTLEAHSMLKTAARLRRLPWYLKPLTLFADPKPSGRFPASAICLLERM